MIVTPIQIPALDIKIHDNKVVFTSIATYTRLHRKGYSKIVCKMILYLLQPSLASVHASFRPGMMLDLLATCLVRKEWEDLRK